MSEPRIEPLITAEAIQSRLEQLADAISAARCGVDPFVIVGILQGSRGFVTDLERALGRRGIRPTIDFLRISSYGAGTKSSGAPRLDQDLRVSVKGRPVLLVDDILDTGLTIAYARDLLLARGAAEVRTCVLLAKQVPRRAADIRPDFIGFPIPNVFVVGYGLDYNNRYRDLPYVGRLATESEGPRSSAG